MPNPNRRFVFTRIAICFLFVLLAALQIRLTAFTIDILSNPQAFPFAPTLDIMTLAFEDPGPAITAAGITGVTAASTAGGQFTVTGTGISTAGSLVQDPIASTNASGTLTFNSSGNLVSPATDVSGITFAGLADGAAALNLNFNLFAGNGAGNISQTAAASATSATNQNGYPTGQYESFAISGSGLISATYSNGQTQTVGQLALATVTP